ncbi:MAG: 3-phosphoshikimate 1-carboxyvinyltransferase [bacterium]
MRGRLRVPGSKSYTHRAYFTALLLGGGTVTNPLDSDDTRATLQCLEEFETTVEANEQKKRIIPANTPPRLEANELDAVESGTLLRFLIPVVSLLSGPDEVTITGRDTLSNRSHTEVIQTLRDNGLKVEASSPEDCIPITCYPGQGIEKGKISLTARTTSQHVSGWLLGLSAIGGGKIRIEGSPVSAPYIDMTVRVLRKAGMDIDKRNGNYQIKRSEAHQFKYSVPADFSSAAFFVVGGLLTEGSLTLEGLDRKDIQADRALVDFLLERNAPVEWITGSQMEGTPLRINGSYRPERFEFDAERCPDLVPILTVLGCFARGGCRIEKIGHLTNKESDRIARTCEELSKVGLEISSSSHYIEIVNNDRLVEPDHEVTLDAHGDHRLAMSFSILGCVLGNVTVRGAECVSKSYPNFFTDLDKVTPSSGR